MTKGALNLQIHKQILTAILLDIFKKFNGKLGFKGGTCAYLFYNLPRASLDLDFDILTSLTESEKDNLRTVLQKHGEIKNFRDKQFTLFFLLDYQKNSPNIKIELNKRIWKNNEYNSIWFLGVEMKIVDKATMLTNKMVALSNRKQPVARDIFDVYYFLKVGFPINEKLIKERTGKNLKDYLNFLLSFIEKNYTPKNVLQGLGEVLDQKQKDWVKKELVSETIKELEKLIK
ncbi:MAG: hypothetical protein COT32_01530 [Candidatus Nealsonbacteria bacterium CG08_land_8_20_14_0_20_36_22]|uniref:Nucleotidyl transferase AbiEii/AbiGii toxin family protein n=1 Tax=Candidatus Nealsonbacteria bacterium CG08_land_8_20_14_0_20_36_22 TaxID=1974704 RepID=A0A2H0YNM3_9BACT|nr:MAG: hypothetical protein COT32_01530 [Candidatus Nealsonbacteria bacterium CG08_land_8_20_14_0_20_36_22]